MTIFAKNAPSILKNPAKTLVGLALFAFLAAASAESEDPAPPISAYENPVRTYKYTNEVFDEIDSNKVRFQRDVDGKIIRVTGYLAEGNVEEDYFAIDGYGTMLPPKISCYPREELLTRMADLKAGQTILITGVTKFDDGVWNTVDLKNCVFTTNVSQRGSSNLSDVLKIFKY